MLVPNYVARHQIDHFLGNVDCKISDPFEMTRCTETMYCWCDVVRVVPHQFVQQINDDAIRAINLIVCRDHRTRLFDIAFNEGVERIFNHSCGTCRHLIKFFRDRKQRILFDRLGTLSNIAREVCHSFKFIVDFDHGEEPTHAGCYRLVQSK